MPNNCTNSFTITNLIPEQWHQIVASFQEEHFLSTFYPEPDWQNIPNDNGELPSTPDENGISRFPDGTQDSRWYDWRNEHWGTKWDVYSCWNNSDIGGPSNSLNVGFCTAWLPLSESCMAHLSRRFPTCLLTNHYQEEGMNFFGVTIAKDGIVRDFTDSISKHRESFMRQYFPDLDARLYAEGLNPAEDLEEYFWDNCDSGHFCDYIQNSYQSLVDKMTAEVVNASALASLTA
jgi:hypothetical protein